MTRASAADITGGTRVPVIAPGRVVAVLAFTRSQADIIRAGIEVVTVGIVALATPLAFAYRVRANIRVIERVAVVAVVGIGGIGTPRAGIANIVGAPVGVAARQRRPALA
jgi:threonine dehydrogenase-like Zn-dependent dehydrogenase